MVPESPRIEPDALAMVMDDSENPISSRYVIRVAEYAKTVSCSRAIEMEAGHIGNEK